MATEIQWTNPFATDDFGNAMWAWLRERVRERRDGEPCPACGSMRFRLTEDQRRRFWQRVEEQRQSQADRLTEAEGRGFQKAIETVRAQLDAWI